MGILSAFVYILKEIIMFQNHKIKKNEEDAYGPPVFSRDYNATGLAAKM
jgi:hypothetical protein